MDTILNSKAVSSIARLRRHERVFGKVSLIAEAARGIIKKGSQAGSKLLSNTGISFGIRLGRHVIQSWRERVVAPTPKTLYKRLAVLGVGVFAVTVVLGSTVDDTYANQDLVMQLQGSTLIADQDGYLTKANPQTVATERTYKDNLNYTVASGDTLSGIATRFNIKSETLMWENGLATASMLRIGQKLSIPPANGVTHNVSKGQTIEKIAQLYKVPVDKIVAMNGLQSGVVSAGQFIFVPDAKPLPQPKTIARATGRDAISRQGSRTNLSNSNDKPTAGKFMIFPTIGKLTQGFVRGHYAYDVGNISKPPVWAAASGTVIKASSGTWGGGYGNYVIIDHGNSIRTLYAHMDYLDVKTGDTVTQGQVIGRMGRTGRVRGITGIHLHFEVIDHGTKKVPSLYY